MRKPCGTAELFSLTFSLVLIVKKMSAGLFPNKRQSFLKYFLFPTFNCLPNVFFSDGTRRSICQFLEKRN